MVDFRCFGRCHNYHHNYGYCDTSQQEEKDNGKGDLQVYGDCEVESEEAADIQNEELKDRTESNNEETETVTEEETEAPDEE